jgi:glycopeptide antibiotics resistance protein
MFINFLPPILYVLKWLLPIWIVYRLLRFIYQQRKRNAVNIKNEILLFLFMAYIGCVVAVTIVPASISGFNDPNAMRLNIVPVINTIKDYIDSLTDASGYKTRSAIENIAGNLMLFIPMGIFLPLLFKNINSLKKVMAICICCSLLIEMIQYFSRSFGTFRTADIDDVILNTASGVLGWLIYINITRRYFYQLIKG